MAWLDTILKKKIADALMIIVRADARIENENVSCTTIK